MSEQQAVETTEEMAAEVTETKPTEQKAEKKVEEPKVVTKATFDKTASELAALKKQLSDRMTDDERKSLEVMEIKAKLEEYERRDKIKDLALELAENGITDKDIAEQFINGETSTAIKKLLKGKDKIISDMQKEIDTLKLQGTTRPPAGEPNNEFAGKSLAELMAMANQNPAIEERIGAHFALQNKKE